MSDTKGSEQRQFPARVRSLVRRGRYRLSLHAERKREADRIQMAELEEALTSEGAEVIEDYAEDPRGHSRLVLGFTRRKRPLHVVCAEHEGSIVVITLYRPDPRLWENWRKRRKERK